MGSTRATRADVRILTATHRDLPRWIREERFREDLYYRLRRVVLTVPPLRERPEDVPLLVEHFRRQVNARHRIGIDGLTPATLRRLTAYRWPGNVREMEAVLEEAMILKSRGWLQPHELILQEPAEGPVASMGPSEGAETTRQLDRRQRVALELARIRGTVTRGQLAAACGISGELARRELQALVALGLLRRGGEGRGTRYGLFLNSAGLGVQGFPHRRTLEPGTPSHVLAPRRRAPFPVDPLGWHPRSVRLHDGAWFDGPLAPA